MENAVLDNIVRVKDLLPKKQKLLCNYVVINYEKISIMTVAELAQNAGVGTTTVMRLVSTLGFESFVDFKRALFDASKGTYTSSYHSLKQGFSGSGYADEKSSLQRVVEDSIHVLNNICSPANLEQFDKAVSLLLRSNTIYTLGLRSSRALSLYFEHNVDRFYPHVRQLSRENEFLFDRVVMNVKQDDVILIYSVWPCTKKTIQAGELAHKLGIPIILITNTSLNPLAKIADVMIDTNSVNHISGDTSLFAVTEALISELGRRTLPDSTKNIERIERILHDNDLITWDKA